MSEAVWVDIPGFEGRYRVSDRGIVMSPSRIDGAGRYKAAQALSHRWCEKRNYGQVQLWDGYKHNSRYVHRLVAEVFIPNPDNLPEVNHKDRDKTNNCVSNLEWVTSQQNSEHAHAKGYVLNWEGEDLFIFNMRKFCRDNNLDRNKIKKLIIERL